MKKLIGTLIILLFFNQSFGQTDLTITNANEKSFPTNLDTNNFNKLKSFEGKIVAFDGLIERIEISRNNTPFYKLRIDDKNYLWTVLMFSNDTNNIGDTVRVVGYLSTIPNNSEFEKNEGKYLDGEYMVISFGLVDFKNSNFLFLEGANIQKQEWIDGKIPSSK